MTLPFTIKRKTAARFLLAAVLFCSSLHSTAHAAWTRSQGEWFTAHTLSNYRSTRFVDGSGNKTPQPAFRKEEWNSYVEYGWSDGLTLGANMFLQRLRAESYEYASLNTNLTSTTQYNYGLPDTEFFLRQRLWEGQLFGRHVVFSAQPLLKLPGVYRDGGNPRSGTDDFDAELRLRAGYSYTALNRHHFTAINAGYRHRFGAWRDQFRSDITFGFGLTDNLMLLLQNSTTLRAEGNTRAAENSGEVSDYDLIRSQASLVYRMTRRTRLQFGAYTHAYARNTGDGGGAVFSIWREF